MLEILAKHKLYLCPKKYTFQKEWIEYLRLIISKNKVLMDSVKVIRVCEWPILENWTNIQVFLGFVNFYKWFIQDFLTIVHSLFDLTHSNQA